MKSGPKKSTWTKEITHITFIRFINTQQYIKKILT
jgi:hypothetical protein